MRLKAFLLSFSVVDEKYYAATSSVFVYTTKLNTYLLLLVAVVLHLFLNCTTQHTFGVTMSECNKPIIFNDTLHFTLL
jgi:Na+/H+ antiporter NhaA